MSFRLGHSAAKRYDHRARLGITSWIVAALLAIICVAFTRAFLLQTFRIPSSSMMPTLLIGDHILVNKMIYGFPVAGGARRILQFAEPKREEIIVFYRFSEFEQLDFNTHYIKRVVAVPGDEVEVKDYRVFVNGEPVRRYDEKLDHGPNLAEPEPGGKNYGPVKLEAGKYFVLGDNQENSRDSRYYGPINFADIEGRASLIYWSWDMRSAPAKIRWERLFKWMR